MMALWINQTSLFERRVWIVFYIWSPFPSQTGYELHLNSMFWATLVGLYVFAVATLYNACPFFPSSSCPYTFARVSSTNILKFAFAVDIWHGVKPAYSQQKMYRKKVDKLTRLADTK